MNRKVKKSRFTVWLAAGIWALLPGIAFAGTINVDPAGVINTIQGGINAASDGDEVVIADGTYTGAGNVNLDFGGKKITVRSANGPAKVIIDCEDTPYTRGVFFDNPQEDGSAVLEGVTITNGNYDFGAGISIQNGASPTIRNVRLVTNIASDSGGGVSVTGSGTEPTFDNCIVSGNTAANAGGGIRIVNLAVAAITNCRIDGNTATAGIGGGLYASDAAVTMRGAIVSDNVAGSAPDGVGGGVAIVGGDASNFATASIIDSTIYGNFAGFEGGGVRFQTIADAHTLEVINAIIYDNSADNGAAVDSFQASPTFYNATIAGNITATGRPVINVHARGTAPEIPTVVTFVNSILWDNADPVITTQTDLDRDGFSSLVIHYSDVQGGAGWDAFSAGTGNIDQDPLFMDTAGDDYRLQSSAALPSPSIDAGDNTSIPANTSQDQTGASRLQDVTTAPDVGNGTAPIVDMGAYENSNIHFEMLAFEVSEGDGSITITARRTDSGAGDITADFATVDVTAMDGSDYTGVNDQFFWGNGDTADKAITIDITDDSIEELSEIIELQLKVSGIIVSSAGLTITDNDPVVGGAGTETAGISGTGSGVCFISTALLD